MFNTLISILFGKHRLHIENVTLFSINTAEHSKRVFLNFFELDICFYIDCLSTTCSGRCIPFFAISDEFFMKAYIIIF